MKKIFIGLLFYLLIFLNGCASFTPSHQEAEALKQNCMNSLVSITDHTKPVANQTFQLPDGRVCDKRFI